MASGYRTPASTALVSRLLARVDPGSLDLSLQSEPGCPATTNAGMFFLEEDPTEEKFEDLLDTTLVMTTTTPSANLSSIWIVDGVCGARSHLCP